MATSGPLFQGVARDGFAMRLMGKMGWKEGKGLGADEDGMATHIHVKKRREGTGIGADVAEHSKYNWTVNTDAFDKVLAGLQQNYGGDDTKGEEGAGGKKADLDSDSDAEEAAAAAAKASKAKKSKDKKKEKKSKKNKKAESGSGSGSDSDSNGGDTKGKARGVPMGRYQKRELNKNVRSYSDKDLSAILGVQFTPVVWTPDEPEPETEVEVRAKTKKEKKRSLIVIEAKEAQEMELTEEARKKMEAFFRLDPDWWGKDIFVRSSERLGDLAPADGTKKERGFEEADQERLYNSTQAGASQGRAGLGKSSQPKKVAGARWKGTKTYSFEEVEEDGEQAAAGAEGAEKADSSTPGKAIKWKKLAEAALEEANGKLKLKKLVKRVLAKVEGDDKQALEAELMAKLQGSSRFVLAGDSITLQQEEVGTKPEKEKKRKGGGKAEVSEKANKKSKIQKA